MYEKQAKYMKLYKYARMCWASYFYFDFVGGKIKFPFGKIKLP